MKKILSLVLACLLYCEILYIFRAFVVNPVYLFQGEEITKGAPSS